LFAGAGLAATQEYPLEGEPSSSLEGLFTLQWQVFSYDFPKTNLQFSAMVYPGLSEWGRVRGDFNLSLKRELARLHGGHPGVRQLRQPPRVGRSGQERLGSDALPGLDVLKSGTIVPGASCGHWPA
jgi:hypothetical protein